MGLFRDTVFKATMFCSITLIMFPFCHKKTFLNDTNLKIFCRLIALQFDICYVIKTRGGFKIAEMTRFLN